MAVSFLRRIEARNDAPDRSPTVALICGQSIQELRHSAELRPLICAQESNDGLGDPFAPGLPISVQGSAPLLGEGNEETAAVPGIVPSGDIPPGLQIRYRPALTLVAYTTPLGKGRRRGITFTIEQAHGLRQRWRQSVGMRASRTHEPADGDPQPLRQVISVRHGSTIQPCCI